MTRQSLWPSYDHNENIQKNDAMRRINDINYQKCKPDKKRGKLGGAVLAVAQCILSQGKIDKNNISSDLRISVRSVETAIKKLKDKEGSGLALPGLSNAEEEMLFKIISQTINNKARWKLITDIFRYHVAGRMFKGGCGVAEIARITGLRKLEVRAVIEGTRGCSMEDLAREMFRKSIGLAEIARRLGMAQKDVKKALPRVVRVAGAYRPPASEGRRISTIKPGSPKSQRKLKKRPASISRTGLAHWCMQHYDSKGILQLPYGCSAPGDLPRRYPREKVQLTNAEPRPSFFPASPPSLAEGTARGRRRLGYARLQ
ncbi:MAG: hypothetical protein JL50_00805 [Peptococcaceae bacterium BICA1-7]|nr:MAG: hypothetical protein JL50_00805 [Peptococcaceae bacterium BICA1-7]HBV98072.1 hypothetical protein [Desulfotomaculum sp.]